MKNIIYIVTVFVMVSCGSEKHEDHTAHDRAAVEQASSKYTCPMHPDVVQDGPGKCPVCGMDLVPVTKSGGNDKALMLSESQVRLANITTQKVTMRSVGQGVIVNGILAVDETRTEMISSRTSGRIERLAIKEVGQLVRKGDVLYELYSESLLTLQREYLLAKEQYDSVGANEPRYASFLKAAERKLILYGLTTSQVQKLAQSKKVDERIVFVSPVSGVVSGIQVIEGQYVSEGMLLYKIDDVSTLWVQADIYPNETGFVKNGDVVQVQVAGYEHTSIAGRIDFINPEYRSNTQIAVVRTSIKNNDGSLRPGMQAQLKFTRSSAKGLAVPIDAVIRDQNGAHVYVQTDVNTFQPRMIKTGTEDFFQVEVTEGLMENETIAATGAYLIYSEFILKKGTDPMAGHNNH